MKHLRLFFGRKQTGSLTPTNEPMTPKSNSLPKNNTEKETRNGPILKVYDDDLWSEKAKKTDDDFLSCLDEDQIIFKEFEKFLLIARMQGFFFLFLIQRHFIVF